MVFCITLKTELPATLSALPWKLLFTASMEALLAQADTISIKFMFQLASHYNSEARAAINPLAANGAVLCSPVHPHFQEVRATHKADTFKLINTF